MNIILTNTTILSTVTSSTVARIVIYSVCTISSILTRLKKPRKTRKTMKTRNDLHRRARRSGIEQDWKLFRNLRNKVKLELRKAEQEYFNRDISENKADSGAIWKTIRRALPNKSNRACYTKDTSILANEFNRFLTSVGEKATCESRELAQLHDLTNYPSPCCSPS